MVVCHAALLWEEVADTLREKAGNPQAQAELRSNLSASGQSFYPHNDLYYKLIPHLLVFIH